MKKDLPKYAAGLFNGILGIAESVHSLDDL